MKDDQVMSLAHRADGGDVRAQLVLGWEMIRSKSSQIDRAKGLEYLNRAAKNGSMEAKYRLAYWKEVTKDASCISIFKELSVAGYSPAMHELGNMYWSGSLVRQNRRRAGVYWRKAAKEGHALGRLRMRALPLHAPFSKSYSRSFLIIYTIYVLIMALCELPGRSLGSRRTSYLGRL